MNVLYVHTLLKNAILKKDSFIKPSKGDKVGLFNITPMGEVDVVVLYPDKKEVEKLGFTDIVDVLVFVS